MSALPPEADIDECDWHVRFVPKADIHRAVIRSVELIVQPGAQDVVGHCPRAPVEGGDTIWFPHSSQGRV
jgi:hypothetical protein